MSLSSRRRRSPSLPSYSPSRSRLTATLFALTILLPTAQAYTWTFTSTPKQCGNLTISVSGSDGRPPYRVLILPFGPTPLAGNIEARRIMDMPFPNGGGSVGFQLKYPANSQFVAVVSMSLDFHCGYIPISLSFLASLSFVVSFQTWINPMPMPTYGHLSPPSSNIAVSCFSGHSSISPPNPPRVGPSRHHIVIIHLVPTPLFSNPCSTQSASCPHNPPVDVDKDNPPTPSINSPSEALSSTDIQNYLSRHTHWNSVAAECRVLAPTLASRLTWISF